MMSSKISALFNASDSDLTIRSRDNTLFKVHKKYLETNTGAFPPAEMETRDEIVALSESAEILELLFQIIYPQRNPDLSSIEFDTLVVLAEAADKYEVYGAIHVCMLTMERALPAHIIEIFAYAAKHEYNSVLDRVAPLALTLPPDSVAKCLPLGMVIPWVCYHGEACRVLFNAMGKIDTPRDWYTDGFKPPWFHYGCKTWTDEIGKKLLIELGRGPGVLLELDSLISAMSLQICDGANCSCGVLPKEWSKWVQRKFNDIGRFSAYI